MRARIHVTCLHLLAGLWIAADGRAYVSLDRSGLCVVDVTDPDTPRALGQAAVDGSWIGDIAVAGDRAYAVNFAGLRIFAILVPVI